MHDVLRTRILRKLESLPEDQVYQVLDYIEFLESKYAPDLSSETTHLQSFAEKLEDQLRKRTVSPSSLREAFQLISAADRVLSGVSSAGKQILSDLGSVLDATPEGEDPSAGAGERRAASDQKPAGPGDKQTGPGAEAKPADDPEGPGQGP